VLAGGLSALSWLYRGGLEANLLGYRLGLLKRTRLGAFVISVGNLTSGGTGKTSATQLIARALMQAEVRVAVLSRGHGGRSAGVVSDGARVLMTAQESGDEPLLTARALPGVPVLVGKDRRVTGAQAIRDFGAQALVLDDGFQYWRLVKDSEIVLVDALNPFGNGRVLPRGLLREPLGHIRRCHAVWITHADLADRGAVEALRERLRRLHPQATLAEARHRPTAIRELGGDAPIPLDRLRGLRVTALSSIGNPAAFEMTLERLGALVAPLRFPDHHAYAPRDLEQVFARACSSTDAILTTEKDAIRLPAVSGPLPIWILRVEMALDPPEAVSQIAEAARRRR
jgi:tetraacyldisaccharide 4'-kinase